MRSYKPNTHAVSVRGEGGLLRVLISNITIENRITKKQIQFRGIWDTGASNTVITKEVVDALE